MLQTPSVTHTDDAQRTEHSRRSLDVAPEPSTEAKITSQSHSTSAGVVPTPVLTHWDVFGGCLRGPRCSGIHTVHAHVSNTESIRAASRIGPANITSTTRTCMQPIDHGLCRPTGTSLVGAHVVRAAQACIQYTHMGRTRKESVRAAGMGPANTPPRHTPGKEQSATTRTESQRRLWWVLTWSTLLRHTYRTRTCVEH